MTEETVREKWFYINTKKDRNHFCIGVGVNGKIYFAGVPESNPHLQHFIGKTLEEIRSSLKEMDGVGIELKPCRNGNAK